MNRNDGRTGLPETFMTDGETTPPIAHGDPNPPPGFSWATPTEFVKLPSGGQFYPEGHPLHGKDTVEIRYMTAKEEDILTSQALIKQGVVIDRLLQSVVIDKSLNINSLLIGDKNALLVATRITGYGEDYTTSVGCPSCQIVSEFSFDLRDGDVTNFVEAAEAHGVHINADGTFTIALPLTQANVTCRLLTGGDEVQLANEAARKSRRKLDESNLTDQFRAFIVAVNGDSSPFNLASFIQSMPARDSRLLRGIYTDIVPSVNMTQNYECSSCGYSADMEVPLTADFFWPK